MQCERIRTQLTAYLEGDLDGDAGTVVRGHLRGCEACRQIASDEAALRDGMRALPPVDPPASLWANVQARLAAEEVAESNRPAWKRTLARWGRMLPAPKFAIAGVLVACAAGAAVYWKTRPVEEPAEIVKHDLIDNGKTQIAPDAPKPKRTHEACVDVPEADDVTADLANDVARSVTAYDCAIEELLTETASIRIHTWDDTQRTAFDERVKSMREAIAKAAEGKPRKHASRALVSYIQRATVREEVLLAGGPQ
jgi:anti-sigma factor RsiW